MQFVLLGICVVLLLWCAVSSWKTQQALRWWFRKEGDDRTSCSDQIQNRLIQDLFVLRLSLQSCSPEQAAEMEMQQTWIATTEALHHSLNELSDVLTFPYLAESLPFAIRSLLKHWQLTHPHCSLQLDLPWNWPPEPSDRSRIILATLQSLLSLALPSSLTGTSLTIRLNDRPDTAALTIKITYPDRSTLIATTRARELKYLRRCFCCLTSGSCMVDYQILEASWQLQWRR